MDVFRRFHPSRQEAFTCWHTKTNSRANNYGTRLDYVLLDSASIDSVSDCQIHPEIEGSDHCPVSAVFDVSVAPAATPPLSCSKNFAEFAGGKQQTMSRFVKARTVTEDVPCVVTEPAAKRQKGSKQLKLSSFFQTNNPKVPSEKNPPTLMEEYAKLPASTGTSSCPKTVDAWRTLLSGPPKAPLCRGHGEAAALRTVSKKGPNQGRQFWACARGSGKEGDPNANCNFFKWLKS